MAESEELEFYFDRALADHAEIYLMFLLDKCQFSSVHGPCTMIKNRHFVVRVPLEQIKHTQIIWGAEVVGYFSVRVEDIKTIHFRSRLVRLYNAPPDALYLIFPLPKRYDFGQRRNSRRVEIDPDNAEAFGIWYGYMEGGNMESIPQQVWKPFRDSDCELGELSASGMRLDFNAANPLIDQLVIDDPVLLKGNFGTASKPVLLFVLGSVVRKMSRKDVEGLMSVGCRFRSWRKVDGPPTWFRASEQEGIAQISQWVSRNFHSLS